MRYDKCTFWDTSYGPLPTYKGKAEQFAKVFSLNILKRKVFRIEVLTETKSNSSILEISYTHFVVQNASVVEHRYTHDCSDANQVDEM